ncbi:MAG: FeoB-associated Cys-rich membrane protein [Candidatus Marinarcus sp.]
MENFWVYVIVAAAVLYFVYKIIKKSKCGCGCGK